MRLNHLAGIIITFLWCIWQTGDCAAGKLIFIHGIAEVYDPSPTFVDAAGILHVRTSDESLWEVSFGGMRSCESDFGLFGISGIEEGKTRVVVIGELMEEGPPIQSKWLDVCKAGTYYNVVDSVVIGSDTVIMVTGKVLDIDATPANGDTMGVLILETGEQGMWWIRFGTGRSPNCTGSLPAIEDRIHELSNVQVAGILRKNGFLEVCEEGTYIRDLNTATITGYSEKIHGIHLKERQSDAGSAFTGTTQHNSNPVTYFTLNGRKLYRGSLQSGGNLVNSPSRSLPLSGIPVSPQVIFHHFGN